MNHLFDTIERTDGSPSSHGESTFDFLNRCSQPAIEQVRQKLDEWARHYPEADRKELVSRMRADFFSPFFELLLHELFRRLGTSLEPHPSVGTKNKKPDFLVRSKEGQTFALEATLMNDTKSDSDENKRRAPLFDAINSIDSPDFFLSLREISDSADRPLITSHVISFIKHRLAELDYDAVLNDYEISNELPRLEFEGKGCRATFHVIPKRTEVRGKHGSRLIGMYPVRFRWGNSAHRVIDSLNRKSKHYGKLEMPFVIAVNTLTPWGIDTKEQQDVLFGTKQEYVAAETGELCTKSLTDGFWGTATNKKCTRVSAVLFGMALPWNVPRIEFCLYNNPWTTHPLPIGLWPLRQAFLENGQITYIDGTASVAEVFELTSDWPGPMFE